MPLTLAAAGPVLKDKYLPGIKDQLNWKTICLSRFQRKGDGDPAIKFDGNQAIMALGVGGNEGLGNRPDNGTLPTAGNQQYARATWTMRYTYARIQVTGPTIKAARSDTGAFIRAIDSEIKGAVRNLKADNNRQLLGNGNAILTAAVSNSTVTVTVINTRFIRIGMTVDIVTLSTGVISSGNGSLVVNGIPSATTFTVTVAPGTTVTTAMGVVRTGNIALTTSYEIFGLQCLNEANPTLGAAQFGAIDRSAAANAYWKGNRLNNSGTLRSISNTLMQTAVDTADIQGEGEISLILTNHGTMRAWGDYLYGKKQFHNVQTLKGGYESIPFNGIPVVADKDLTADASVTGASKFSTASASRLYFLDESTMGLIEMSDWDWMDLDGDVLSRVANTDAYEATLYKYYNYYCERPNASCILDDITEG